MVAGFPELVNVGGDASGGEQMSVGMLLDVTVRFTRGCCQTAV